MTKRTFDFSILGLEKAPEFHNYPLVKDPENVEAKTYTYQGQTVPNFVSWAAKYPGVWNQGDTNSCTAQAISGALSYTTGKFDPSRLFQYYNERLIYGEDNHVNYLDQDSGVNLSSAVKAFLKYGICGENLWPFNAGAMFLKPSVTCYSAATKGPLKEALKIQTPGSANSNLINELVEVIAQGNPVIIGIEVYPSFESLETSQTAVIPMPSNNHPPLGGHAVVLVGYNIEKQVFVFRNSWGPAWGHLGYALIPFDYIKEYCISAWVLVKGGYENSSESFVSTLSAEPA